MLRFEPVAQLGRVVESSSSARSDPAATAGVMLFENRYGRDRWRSSATISLRAAV